MVKTEIIQNGIIYLESLPQYWGAEESGKKSNTVRIRTCEDIMNNALEIFQGKIYHRGEEITDINISEVGTHRQFKRKLTHVCVYKNIIIYSWSD